MQKIHKELHVIQLRHRWNKNIPMHKTHIHVVTVI